MANDSFSHRSFHHSMVTRSPNHMWASSWRMVSARPSYAASVTFERKTYWSRMVTAPAFSIAPALNSGTKSWSYLANGYAKSNFSSNQSKPCRVTSKIASASRCSASDGRQ